MSSRPLKTLKPQTNTIYRGDNLSIMRAMPSECVDLIYIDPPFFTQRDYKNIWGDREAVLDFESDFFDGFEDTKDFFERHIQSSATGLKAYLEWMRARLVELHRTLKPTGSFYCHLDHHAVHYVKVILDEIFGYNRFRNQMVWKRKTGSNSTSKTPNNYPVNVDYILFYTKSDEYVFNPEYTAYTEEFRAKYYNKKDANGRWYKIENLGAPSHSPTLVFDYKGYKTPKNGWRWTKSRMVEAEKKGLLHFCKKNGGKGSIKQRVYFDEIPGMPVESIWDDVAPLTAGDKERTGWRTQKPVVLLDRIIRTSSNEGDVVFDCFAGCGTSLHAAHTLRRKWIGIDISPTAIKVNRKRLEDLKAKVTVIDENDLAPDLGKTRFERKVKRSA
jgi:site-specific DNA-methyltransferase (adenine-specific)